LFLFPSPLQAPALADHAGRGACATCWHQRPACSVSKRLACLTGAWPALSNAPVMPPPSRAGKRPDPCRPWLRPAALAGAVGGAGQPAAGRRRGRAPGIAIRQSRLISSPTERDHAAARICSTLEARSGNLIRKPANSWICEESWCSQYPVHVCDRPCAWPAWPEGSATVGQHAVVRSGHQLPPLTGNRRC